MKTIFTLVSLFLFLQIFSQINVGPELNVKLKENIFTSEQLDILKDTKTYFIYRKNDDIDIFEKTLNKSWSITDIEFISYEKFNSLEINKPISVFRIEGLIKSRTTKMSGTSQSTQIYLTLSIDSDGEKRYYARVDLYHDIYAYAKLSEKYAEGESKAMDYLYNEAIFYNWNVGYLKNALKLINDKLTNSQTRWIYENKTTNQVDRLKNETLYILDYTINMQLMDKSNAKRFEKFENKILGNYPYEYKIITSKEMDDLVLSNKPFLYLTCIKTGSNKFITITDNSNSQIIYSKYIVTGMIPGMNKGNFDTLIKELK